MIDDKIKNVLIALGVEHLIEQNQKLIAENKRLQALMAMKGSDEETVIKFKTKAPFGVIAKIHRKSVR